MALLPYSDGLAGPSKQHGFIGLGFPYLIGAVGQHVIAGTGTARLVRGDGHDHILSLIHIWLRDARDTIAVGQQGQVLAPLVEP